ncbi:TPA: WxL domain-containing protein [Enterococcus faecalis]|uniref:WxL domain-containing protein n=1 Tax=Enterococcus faecalis TaxID=1351 RepID=UPI001571698C|nr:WxL domain-containing protein [Enterococcus faecalis]MDV7776670.1 WxL domain-containing protein [Enterococcus faecalis]NSQ23484.1 WxL domain-containing protein [Enterococcus faecalis]HCJ4253141.1 WxL domain-containing protein [Enterococcus faecalis]
MKRSKWKELIVTGICHILVFPILIQTTVFAETLPSTKQVREGTNHSLTAEKAESEQPQTKDKLHDEEPLALPKSELIDNEANVTSQTIRERIETPNLTYRYGFINEEGQLVNANEILLQYHSWQGNSPNGINVWEGESQPVTASTVANLKEVVIPSEKVAVYSDMSTVLAASNQTFFLPRYYTSLSLYNKKGEIDPNYPLPTISDASGNQYPTTISQFELEKISAQQYSQKTGVTFNISESQKLIVPLYNQVKVDSSNQSGLLNYFKFSGPVYYHVTNRKVTEHFVDTQGKPIPPPPGFRQGKQTLIERDPYTFKQNGLLPSSYEIDSKTYQFQGWYKGKTKPENLEKSVTPSYDITYDDNDDLTVVYKEIPQKNYTFEDVNGVEIAPPSDFIQDHQQPITTDGFRYLAGKKLPQQYSVNGKTYLYQGWYQDKTKQESLEKTKRPINSPVFNEMNAITAVYKEITAKAEMQIEGLVKVMPSGYIQIWQIMLTNVGEVPLKKINLKPASGWSPGLARPIQVTIRVGSEPNKIVPITDENWRVGIALNTEVPIGQTATIMMTTIATGEPDQVLQAAVEMNGNFSAVHAADTVRIQPKNQEIVAPDEEGFISTPTFDFGKVAISSNTQQHGLKQAADYYENGQENPYLRLKKSQPNWALTAELSPFEGRVDQLSSMTKLLLGTTNVSGFIQYNQPTETKVALGKTTAIQLVANGVASHIVANGQFDESDVYQFDFSFDQIKLEIPANQGRKDQAYQAMVTWNLVTGP